MSVAAVILAAGAGLRLGGHLNKVFVEIGGRPMLEYPLLVLGSAPEVSRIAVVVNERDADRAEAVVTRADLEAPHQLVFGGSTRQESEFAGLTAISDAIESREAPWVALHDAARPFLTLPLLRKLIATARQYGGAVPALAPSSSLFRLEGGKPVLFPARNLVRVQTPQVFAAGPLLSAYRLAAAAGFTGVDTAETVERFSRLTVAAAPGDPRNIKITYPDDLTVAEDIAKQWRAQGWQD